MLDCRAHPLEHPQLVLAREMLKATHGNVFCPGNEMVATETALPVFLYGTAALNLHELINHADGTFPLQEALPYEFWALNPSVVGPSGIAASRGWTHYVALLASDKFHYKPYGDGATMLVRRGAGDANYPVLVFGNLSY